MNRTADRHARPSRPPLRGVAGFALAGLFCLSGMAAAAPAPGGDAKPAAKKPATKRPPNPALQPVPDDATLPRVLLIGDSISMGYTVPVRDRLKGKANVHRPLTNAGPTTRGLAELDNWLAAANTGGPSDRKWDVIHFNFGLHDLKYADGKGTIADVTTGKQQVPPAEYERNLRELVKRLRATDAALVWCSTTPVPEGTTGRIAGDEVRYNDVAARVMKEGGVATNDLFAFSKARLADIQRPANVHFSDEGSTVLAEQVAEAIVAALAGRKPAKGG